MLDEYVLRSGQSDDCLALDERPQRLPLQRKREWSESVGLTVAAEGVLWYELLTDFWYVILDKSFLFLEAGAGVLKKEDLGKSIQCHGKLSTRRENYDVVKLRRYVLECAGLSIIDRIAHPRMWIPDGVPPGKRIPSPVKLW